VQGTWRRTRAARLIAAAALGTVTLGVVSEACRAPTQVTLDVTYTGKCSDLGGVAFVVGTDPHDAERRIPSFTTVTSACTDGSPARIGTLVVTPSDGTSRGAVVILAGFGKPPGACDPAKGYFDCVVARRTFSFLDHASPTLPVQLTPDCRSVSCDAVSTCYRGQCISSDVLCRETGCSDVGVLPDGGPIAPLDGSADGPADGPPPTDAPLDVTADTSVGPCAEHEQPVQCPGPMAPAGPCLANETCCGFACAPQGSGQTCEIAGNCPQFNMECAGARNCKAGSICCLTSTTGTSCVVGAVCPLGGGGPQDLQVCEHDCECGALVCGGFRDGFKALPKRCR